MILIQVELQNGCKVIIQDDLIVKKIFESPFLFLLLHFSHRNKRQPMKDEDARNVTMATQSNERYVGASRFISAASVKRSRSPVSAFVVKFRNRHFKLLF
ncbi:hypothetical protein CEXT_664651 [Caerostris extrusa]|uniref:Uncharacterized protein n=1 Tax=Caerostris extrusa TaxID=172846 RepID=A0AAV4PSW5_CAEEX|nr:hypothetical protein CEXT_664651 [Caerostris extrusa]